MQALIVAPESKIDDKVGPYFLVSHPMNAPQPNTTAVTPSPCQGTKRIPLLWGGTQGALPADGTARLVCAWWCGQMSVWLGLPSSGHEIMKNVCIDAVIELHLLPQL